jgi:hypothetical protein
MWLFGIHPANVGRGSPGARCDCGFRSGGACVIMEPEVVIFEMGAMGIPERVL